MKKTIIAVIGAVLLIAVLCFSACMANGKVNDSATDGRNSSTRASGILGDETRDMEDRISEGLSNAGDAVRDGVTDLSEAASDVAEDIRDDLGMNETTTKPKD